MPKANAFMSFVTEWKRTNAPNISVPEAVKLAGSYWEKMSTEERQLYAPDLSTITQTGNSKPKKGPSNCLRNPIAKELQAEREKNYKEQLEKETIKKIIQNSPDLKQQTFHFIFVNFFIPENAIPAEIAVIEFSLKEGVRRQKHWFVKNTNNNNNSDFYGMLATAFEHVKSTHQLPLPPKSLGKLGPHEIYVEILEFLNNSNDTNYPPLYTDNNYMQGVQKTFALTHKPNNEKLTIYSIQNLFYLLKCATGAAKGAVIKNIHVTNIILERDPFEFEDVIACRYHQDIDRSRYCALSRVIRWAYTFADYILKDLDLEFIPGKHCPIHITKITNKVEETCESVSALSLENTVNATLTSFEVNTSNKKFGPSKTAFYKKATSIVPECSSSCNPGKKQGQTSIIDTHHFDLDAVVPQSYRGRGIALLDENKIPKFVSLGRGSLLGRGIAVLNDTTISSVSGIERDNHLNDSRL